MQKFLIITIFLFVQNLSICQINITNVFLINYKPTLSFQSKVLPKKTFLSLPTFSKNQSPLTIPSNYYCTQLGFVCKKELLVQKAIKFPLFFRLGSLEYCNKLEGKH